jgi:hypothetical protein
MHAAYATHGLPEQLSIELVQVRTEWGDRF